MPLYFITSNKGKFEEAKDYLGEVEQLDLDLIEIQHLDPQKIIEHKLQEALKHVKGEVIVDDVSLHLEALYGMPGPFTKWFEKKIGIENFVRILKKLGNTKAEARLIIGYANSKGKMHFFEGSMKGEIVAPKGDKGYGWDSIFVPEGLNKTFAELSVKEKNKVSHRGKALVKLKKFLEKN